MWEIKRTKSWPWDIVKKTLFALLRARKIEGFEYWCNCDTKSQFAGHIRNEWGQRKCHDTWLRGRGLLCRDRARERFEIQYTMECGWEPCLICCERDWFETLVLLWGEMDIAEHSHIRWKDKLAMRRMVDRQRFACWDRYKERDLRCGMPCDAVEKLVCLLWARRN